MKNIELYEAGINDRALVENLMQLYLHDLSEYMPLEIGPNGRFEQKVTTKYFGAFDYKVQIIHADFHILGFMLVHDTPDEKIVKDLFVLRMWRRKQVAMSAMELMLQSGKSVKVEFDRRNGAAERFTEELDQNAKFNVTTEQVGGNIEVSIA